MFAVIKTGGKQYKVQEGDILDVEKLKLEQGQKISFDQILLIDDDSKTLIGTPYLENAVVTGEVIENFRDRKVIVFKKKRRKQYRKKTGHRQELTRVRIEEIIPDLKAAPKKAAKPAEKAKAAPQVPKAKPEKKAKPKKPEEKRPRMQKEARSVKKVTKVQKPVKAAKAAKTKSSPVKKTASKPAPRARKGTEKKE